MNSIQKYVYTKHGFGTMDDSVGEGMKRVSTPCSWKFETHKRASMLNTVLPPPPFSKAKKVLLLSSAPRNYPRVTNHVREAILRAMFSLGAIVFFF